MPKVPRHTAEKDLQVIPSGPRRSVAEAGMIGQTVSGLGRTIEGIGQKFRESQQLIILNQHLNKSTLEIADLERAYETDEDFDTLAQRAKSDLFRLKSARIKLITDPGVRDVFSRSFDNKAVGAMMHIQDAGRVRQIDIGRAGTIEAVRTLQKSYFDAASIQEGTSKLAQIRATYSAAVKAGFMDHEEAATRLRATMTQIVETELLGKIQMNPVEVYEDLLDGVYDAELSEKQKVRFLALAKPAAEKERFEDAVFKGYKAMLKLNGNDIAGLNKSISYLSDPDWIEKAGISLPAAQRIEGILKADIAETQARLDYSKTQQRNAELDAFYNMLMADENDRDGLLHLVNKMVHVESETKYKLSEALKKTKWVTDPAVQSQVHAAIMDGSITERSQIYQSVGHGLTLPNAQVLEKVLEKEKGIRGQRNFYKLAVDNFRANGDKEELADFEASLSYLMRKENLLSNDPKTYELGKSLMEDVITKERGFPLFKDSHEKLYKLIADEDPPWLGGSDEDFRPLLEKAVPWLTGNKLEGQITRPQPAPDIPDSDLEIPDATPDEIKTIYRTLNDAGQPLAPENKKYLLDQIRKGK